jgi:hypothetical protein
MAKSGSSLPPQAQRPQTQEPSEAGATPAREHPAEGKAPRSPRAVPRAPEWPRARRPAVGPRAVDPEAAAPPGPAAESARRSGASPPRPPSRARVESAGPTPAEDRRRAWRPEAALTASRARWAAAAPRDGGPRAPRSAEAHRRACPRADAARAAAAARTCRAAAVPAWAREAAAEAAEGGTPNTDAHVSSKGFPNHRAVRPLGGCHGHHQRKGSKFPTPVSLPFITPVPGGGAAPTSAGQAPCRPPQSGRVSNVGRPCGRGAQAGRLRVKMATCGLKAEASSREPA